jgi:hypothetical protein
MYIQMELDWMIRLFRRLELPGLPSAPASFRKNVSMNFEKAGTEMMGK